MAIRILLSFLQKYGHANPTGKEGGGDTDESTLTAFWEKQPTTKLIFLRNNSLIF